LATVGVLGVAVNHTILAAGSSCFTVTLVEEGALVPPTPVTGR
jgi:hypothetical protein